MLARHQTPAGHREMQPAGSRGRRNRRGCETRQRAERVSGNLDRSRWMPPRLSAACNSGSGRDYPPPQAHARLHNSGSERDRSNDSLLCVSSSWRQDCGGADTSEARLNEAFASSGGPVMALFIVRHEHSAERCPAADPEMGALLLNHLSAPNVKREGVELQAEAVVQGQHTIYMIVESSDEGRVP